MPGLVYDLMDILDKQLIHFDELINLSTLKKELIISNDTAGLSRVTAKENAITNKLQKLDKTRASLMSDISNVIGKTAGVTLSELADKLRSQPEHERLNALAVSTRDKLQELKTLNDLNRSLIDSSLDYISFTINAIRSSLLPEQAIYSKDGEELGQRQSFFDAKQ